MQRVWTGFLGILIVGTCLFTAPIWSQSPDEGNQAPPPAREPDGPPPGPPGGFPGFPPGGPGGFQFPLDPLSAAIDLDGNRELSAEELTKAPESITRLDKNKDGKLTPEEVLSPFLLGGGMGGPPGGQDRKLLKEFDKDGNGYLTLDERAAARKNPPPAGGRGFGGPPGFGGGFGGRNSEPPKPGRKLIPAEVEQYPGKGLYDPSVLRTVFIDFENADWEQELSDFHSTDVEVPATLTVDGKTYPNVGLHFRGMSSYMMVGQGYKRSLNLAMDLVDPDQKLYGYKTLNLLNSNGDPAMMSSVLYSQIASEYLPTPKASFVRVVINGECWGVYINVQQFN